MYIPSQSYETIYHKYISAILWMKEIGVVINQGRTSHYEKVIDYWKNEYKTASTEKAEKIFPDFVSSMFEVNDFINIFLAFQNVQPHHLTSIVDKLQKGVNGPINRIDETPESTEARNFLFEAVVAAKIHSPSSGVKAILDAKSDTGISYNKKKIWVECKRVTTIGQLESNSRRASRQLELMLPKQIGSGHRGIIALDISKILNQGDKIFVNQNDNELVLSLNHLMDKFIEENSHVWERVYERRSKKIIGTILRFSFMSSSEARNLLVHSTQWGMNPRLDISDSEMSTLIKISAALGAK